MKNFHLHLSKKLFFETLSSREKYRSSCTGVFYENKCSEKCPENSHIQRLREDSFVEPEVEREATGFPFELSQDLQSNLDLIKSLSKERLKNLKTEKLKSGNFTLH